MLTHDLLRYKTVNSYARIQFISPDDPGLLHLASTLIAVFENALHCTRQELHSALSPLVNRTRDVILAKGLVKLLMDKSLFSGETPEEGESFPVRREKLFQRSMELLNSDACPGTMDEFRDRVWEAFPGEEERTVYCDLPEYERLVKVPGIYPKELLERYNVSLVQSLILYAGELDCVLDASDPALLRRFFKYLKFFRLLFTAELKKKKKTDEYPVIRLKIDGPASLLEHNTRYGLLLASFFPAVCAFPHWKIGCDLKIREKKLRLKLDEESHLRWSYTHFGAYVPEEFKLFSDYFTANQEENSWQMIPRESFLSLAGNKLAFPDFRFRHKESGQEVDVELFHPWHKNELAARIEYLEKHPDTALILGTDRSCLKKDEELTMRFKNRMGNFLFSAYPGVENVLKSLERYRNGK